MNLKNHFLIAMPTLEDERFQRSVIYLSEHSETGARGLIINQPIKNFTVDKQLLHQLDIPPISLGSHSNVNKQVLYGGPLGNDQLFVIHMLENRFSTNIKITDKITIMASKHLLDALYMPEQLRNILISIGYAQWQSGQLEQEIINNSWLTVPADMKIMFRTPLSERWKMAAKKLGIDIYNISSHIGHA